MTTKPNIDCFFIFGCPRSGTSLLSRMLDSHPELSVPFESHIFKMFWNQQRFYGDLSNKENQILLIKDVLNTTILSYWSPTPEYSEVLLNLKVPGFEGVVDALMSSYSQNASQLWGEKTPAHIFYWPEIKQCFPETKVIHLVRDGRDVARSLVSARFGPVTLGFAAQFWNKYIAAFEAVKRNSNKDDYLQVKYEDLISQPEQVLSKICGLLSVEYSTEMLNFYTKDVAYPTDNTNMDNLRSPLIKHNSRKWKAQLSNLEIQEIENICGSSLQKLGYRMSGIEPGEPLRSIDKSKLMSYLRWAISRAKDIQGQKELINLKLIRLKRMLQYYLRH